MALALPYRCGIEKLLPIAVLYLDSFDDLLGWLLDITVYDREYVAILIIVSCIRFVNTRFPDLFVTYICLVKLESKDGAKLWKTMKSTCSEAQARLLVCLDQSYIHRRLRVEVSLKSRSNFEICNILAALKDLENS